MVILSKSSLAIFCAFLRPSKDKWDGWDEWDKWDGWDVMENEIAA
jgi:hypothetical protein